MLLYLRHEIKSWFGPSYNSRKVEKWPSFMERATRKPC